MDDYALVWPFPMPDSELIREAYWDLYLSENGTDGAEARSDEADQLPRPWDIATCTDPDLRRDVWEWYEQFVTWFNHEYVWDPAAGMIPPCWPLPPAPRPRHRRPRRPAPHDRASHQQQLASKNGTATPSPPSSARLRERIKQHCDDNHQPWPARTRFGRHKSVPQADSRNAAILADVGTPDQPPAVPVRPRLWLVDENGDTIDPETGQVPSPGRVE